MPTPGIDVFLYGSLLDRAVLHEKAGRRFSDPELRPARLTGWRRAQLRGTPWPMLVRDRGGQVDGVVLRLTGAPLRRLVAYKGSAYRLRPLRLRIGGGDHYPVWAWMASVALAARPGGAPRAHAMKRSELCAKPDPGIVRQATCNRNVGAILAFRVCDAMVRRSG